MIYLSGGVHPELAEMPDAGYMLTPLMGNRPDLSTTLWAADNGCFSAPEKFSLEGYLGWLTERQDVVSTCLFATAPDVVGDARATWERSEAVLPVIRRLGYRAALVAQDGLEEMEVPWDAFDCLFVGGSTQWKLSQAAYRLMRQADARGKWTHMGRVNSWRRFKAAGVSGYDSADGTFLVFGPDKNLPRLMSWIETLRLQPGLEWADANP